MDSRLHNALAQGVTVLTATARLARHAQLGYARLQRENGRESWETPAIIAWDGWLQQLHARAQWLAEPVDEVLLNPAQEQVLWERIIAGSDSAEQLLDLAATATLAREAATAIRAWHLPDVATVELASDDVRAFGGWLEAYQARCREGRWLDAARLANSARTLVASGRLAAPRSVLLLGFERLTPQQRNLLRALEDRGAQVSAMRGPRKPRNATRLVFRDPEEELAVVARWLRQLLSTISGARIGVIVPRLTERREMVTRQLDDVLLADSLAPTAGPCARPYNLSRAPRLADYPVIRTARSVIELATGRIPTPAITQLLHSPFLSGGDSELSGRASFDIWMRAQRFVELDLAALARLLEAYAWPTGGVLSVLAGTVARAQATRNGADVRQRPSEWAVHFQELLLAFGWPGERRLDSPEYQSVVAFRALLTRFASLDAVQGRIPVDRARNQLGRMLASEAFQPETPEVPIQVLGLDEAYGLEFDHLWITGLDDEHWPPAASPNPFIPVEWQRQHGLPGATASEQLAYARRVTHRLLHSAGRVWVSHAAREDDRELAPSPLVRELRLSSLVELSLAEVEDYGSRSRGNALIEHVQDEWAPEVDPARVRGGARLLELQAACPFRAYGELRLGAREFERPQPGLDPRERGLLLHTALEGVWRRLGSWRGLVVMTRKRQLEKLVRGVIEETLAEFSRRLRAPLAERHWELERARLEALVRSWLRHELERAPFEVVGTEMERELGLGGLSLRIRVDRVDRLQRAGVVVIDYKSGLASPTSAWMGPRPDEPQVPLYALAESEPAAALLIACVTRGDLRFHGIAREAGIAPAVAAFDDTPAARRHGLGWEALIDGWRSALERLAAAFASGDARVDPKHGPATCRQCHLATLCRIAERQKLVPVAGGE